MSVLFFTLSISLFLWRSLSFSPCFCSGSFSSQLEEVAILRRATCPYFVLVFFEFFFHLFFGSFFSLLFHIIHSRRLQTVKYFLIRYTTKFSPIFFLLLLLCIIFSSFFFQTILSLASARCPVDWTVTIRIYWTIYVLSYNGRMMVTTLRLELFFPLLLLQKVFFNDNFLLLLSY